MTEIRNPSNSVLVCEESAPVLSLCYNIDQTGIWVCLFQNNTNCDFSTETNIYFQSNLFIIRCIDNNLEFRY